MRNASMLVGLTLFALATTTHAQEAAPGAAQAAPATGGATGAPTIEPPPATATPVPPAGGVATTPRAAQPATTPRKLELGLSFMPMAAGRFTYSPTGEAKTVDAGFAYGFSLSGSYEALPGLFVGLAPQLTFNVKDKTVSDTAKEIDILARVAYAYRPVDTIAVYAEVLPGYSIILPPAGIAPRGMVVAFGAGSIMDISDRVFANLGIGYQIGFQNRKQDNLQLETRTRYVRVTLGGGMRF